MNAGDRNDLMLSIPPAMFLGGSRRLIVKLATVRRLRMMKPKMRMVHGNLTSSEVVFFAYSCHVTYPTIGMSLRATIGNAIPPMDPPKAVKPQATPSFFLNQFPTIPVSGPKHTPHANCGIGLVTQTREGMEKSAYSDQYAVH